MLRYLVEGHAYFMDVGQHHVFPDHALEFLNEVIDAIRGQYLEVQRIQFADKVLFRHASLAGGDPVLVIICEHFPTERMRPVIRSNSQDTRCVPASSFFRATVASRGHFAIALPILPHLVVSGLKALQRLVSLKPSIICSIFLKLGRASIRPAGSRTTAPLSGIIGSDDKYLINICVAMQLPAFTASASFLWIRHNMHNYHSKLLLYSIIIGCMCERREVKSGKMTLFKNSDNRMLALLTLSFAGFAASFTGHLIASNLGTYMGAFGSTNMQIGLVIGSLAIAEVIFKTPFGILSDRYGRLKFMLFGFVVLIVVSVAYPLFHDTTILFSIRFVQGVSIGAFSTTSVAVVADMFQENKGEAMGIYNSIKGAGYALGPIAGGLIIQYLGDFNMMFWLCAGVALVCLLLTLLFVRESFNPKEHQRKAASAMLREGFRLDLLSSYFIGMSGMLVFYAIISFLPLYGAENHIDTGTTGLILGLQAVVYVLAQYYSGKMADKYGSRLPMMVGAILLTTALLMIALFPSVPVWLAAVVLSGTASRRSGDIQLVSAYAALRHYGTADCPAHSKKSGRRRADPAGFLGDWVATFSFRLALSHCAVVPAGFTIRDEKKETVEAAVKIKPDAGCFNGTGPGHCARQGRQGPRAPSL
jgi:MFS family permease